MIGIKDQCFGCEIEMTGLSRARAAQAIAELFGTGCQHYGGYDAYHIIDHEGKEWKIVSDSSIEATARQGNRQRHIADSTYKVEMNSPKLEYSEMEKLQEVVRALRHAGAVVNPSCGMHVHVDGANHTPQSIKNVLSIMYSKEDILFAALNVNETRVSRWCQKVREPMLQKVRKLPKSATDTQLANIWYEGHSSTTDHYHWTRYYACNVHSYFYRGTVEWRCFNSTLHAGEVRANITLALAISAQAINQTRTVMRKTPIGDNPAFTFRTFLLRLGFIGPEYKNVREHLLNTPGYPGWPSKEAAMVNGLPAGYSENGGVFCQANCWAIMAEALLGRGDMAWKYYKQILPHSVIKKIGVERYHSEAYAYCSTMLGKDNEKFGWGCVSQVTGTAAWMDVVSTQYLLGVRPTLKGLLIDPSIPAQWDGYTVERLYRGCKLTIQVENPAHVQHGVKSMTVNGKQVNGAYITEELLGGCKEAQVHVVMG